MTNTILTITLNPTVDKSSSVANIKPEKKLRCETPKYEPGGGGINVSRGLVRLGITNSALFTSGGRTGELLEKLLNKEKVTALPIRVSGETRENFIVVATASNEQYRFGMPGQIVTDVDKTQIIEKIEKLSPFPDIVVISGSLPPGIAPDFLKKLIQIAKNNNSKVVIDSSGEALSAALDEGLYLVKPNIGELSRMTNIPHLDNDNVEKAAKNLINKGKAEIIVVSMGAQGAYLITKNESIHLPAPSVKKLSTVGAGDSMVAGMISILAKGGTPLEMARMGIACGSAATMNPGTGLFKPEDAYKLYEWLTKYPL